MFIFDTDTRTNCRNLWKLSRTSKFLQTVASLIGNTQRICVEGKEMWDRSSHLVVNAER